MFNFHKNHKLLVLVSFIGFLLLSLLVSVLPAYQMADVQPLPDQEDLTLKERKGLNIYIKEGCVACHTQQVRNIEMDKVWGKRPSIPSDYYYSKERMDVWRQSPSLLGSERTGPDLTNIGLRQPSEDWHLLHLYNPRAVVKESVMPSYPWLFKIVDSSAVKDSDKVITLPQAYAVPKEKKIIATAEAMELVAYLQSLKQHTLPGEMESDFIPARTKKPSSSTTAGKETSGPDGEALYQQICAACHQVTGTGVAGAFPPLADSPIVNNEDHSQMIEIILQGYDARPEYAVMIGYADQLSDAEIAAIANHERTSWGNNAPKVTAEDVKKIRDYIKTLQTE